MPVNELHEYLVLFAVKLVLLEAPIMRLGLFSTWAAGDVCRNGLCSHDSTLADHMPKITENT